MRKALSKEELLRRKKMLWAIEDYFGEEIPEASFKRILARVQGKKGELETPEEIKAAWAIRQNLNDPVYTQNLASPKNDVA